MKKKNVHFGEVVAIITPLAFLRAYLSRPASKTKIGRRASCRDFSAVHSIYFEFPLLCPQTFRGAFLLTKTRPDEGVSCLRFLARITAASFSGFFSFTVALVLKLNLG